MKSIFALAAALVLSLSTAAQAAEPINVLQAVRSGNRFPSILPVSRTDLLSLKVRVTSGGCTSPEDFSVMLNPASDETLEVTIVRHRQDLCQAYFPEGAVIELSTDISSAVRDVVVTNPQLVKARFAY